VPTLKEKFPPVFVPRAGSEVVLVLEPYREFVSMLSPDLLNATEMTAIQLICAAPTPTVRAVVQKTEKLAQRGAEAMGAAFFVTVTYDGEDKGQKILFAPFSSPLNTDVYLVDYQQFRSSVRAPWLVNGAPVRRAFAADDGNGIEWLEGW
jgi:hypothetical protein